MKIRINNNDTFITANLNESETAKSFASMLPININLDDYGQTSKISKLEERLDENDSIDGFAPKAGDIVYFAPLGNIAFFYKNSEFSDSLIKLGEIDGDVKALRDVERIKARIELAEQAPNSLLSKLKNKELQEDE
ncbi:cyclophilin-like fold protein [uncultured Draconibacterium sp.]|uniref:cyclophilin-like fold protein n=1 Tax=uncultured Draconibacterium sp. TaxID=1573823 RepID=UPI0025DE9CA4|nr:cyclophilin-like fold protein [uncultured Draconibacterium sp.]